MIESIASLYRLTFVRAVTSLLAKNNYSISGFLKQFWQTHNFHKVASFKGKKQGSFESFLIYFLVVGLALHYIGCLALAIWGWNNRVDNPGIFQMAIGLGLLAPVIWAHLLIIPVLIKKLVEFILHPKTTGRKILSAIMIHQVKQLIQQRDFKIVAVVGSVGKTGTKMAISRTLEQKFKVNYQTGNYNVDLTVPLVIFNHNMPSLYNLPAWAKIIWSNQRQIKQVYPYHVVVLELGTDGPGQMKQFAYLQPDITVVTAVAEEHMEFFKTLDAVAEEELAVAKFSKELLINTDDTDKKYLGSFKFTSYGTNESADYSADNIKPADDFTQKMTIKYVGSKINVQTKLLGEQGLKNVLAAVACAEKLGLNKTEIKNAVSLLEPFSGRMQILNGIKNSTIIDDTYNSNPKSVLAALDFVYQTAAPQKIAILGSMNELGKASAEAHQTVGKYCDPKQLDLVVTIGAAAEEWLVPAAKKAGCEVQSFSSPYQAGDFVKEQLKSGAIVLAKGSQNRVFAEESLKVLLKSAKDEQKLVRQSKLWLKTKRRQFNS